MRSKPLTTDYMRVIHVCTSNVVKREQWRTVARDFPDVQLIFHRYSVDELQGSEEDIVRDKYCHDVTGVVDDESLYLLDYCDMPGPYVKWFTDGPEKTQRFARTFAGARARSVVRLYDGRNIYEGSWTGTVENREGREDGLCLSDIVNTAAARREAIIALLSS